MTKSPKHLAYIDGLRACAALWVMLFHLWVFRYWNVPNPLGYLVNWLTYSHVPVDSFIVISGFCLTLPLVQDLRLRGTTIDFYLRRAKRILPPLYASLLLSIAYTLTVNRFGVHVQHITPKSLLANIFLLQDYLPNYNFFNGVLWSVAAEWKIYLLFPLFVFLLRRFGASQMLGVVAALAAVHTIVLQLAHPSRVLILTCPWYVLLFAFGMVAAYVSNNEKVRLSASKYIPALAVAGLLAYCIFVAFWPLHRYPTERQIIIFDLVTGASFAAILAYLSIDSGSFLRRPFENRALVFIGTFSYSIYLTHIIVLFIVRAVIDKLQPLANHPIVRFELLGLIGVPAVFCFAYLFFLAVERPFLVRRKLETLAEVSRDAALSPAP